MRPKSTARLRKGNCRLCGLHEFVDARLFAGVLPHLKSSLPDLGGFDLEVVGVRGDEDVQVTRDAATLLEPVDRRLILAHAGGDVNLLAAGGLA